MNKEFGEFTRQPSGAINHQVIRSEGAKPFMLERTASPVRLEKQPVTPKVLDISPNRLQIHQGKMHLDTEESMAMVRKQRPLTINQPALERESVQQKTESPVKTEEDKMHMNQFLSEAHVIPLIPEQHPDDAGGRVYTIGHNEPKLLRTETIPLSDVEKQQIIARELAKQASPHPTQEKTIPTEEKKHPKERVQKAFFGQPGYGRSQETTGKSYFDALRRKSQKQEQQVKVTDDRSEQHEPSMPTVENERPPQVNISVILLYDGFRVAGSISRWINRYKGGEITQQQLASDAEIPDGAEVKMNAAGFQCPTAQEVQQNTTVSEKRRKSRLRYLMEVFDIFAEELEDEEFKAISILIAVALALGRGMILFAFTKHNDEEDGDEDQSKLEQLLKPFSKRKSSHEGQRGPSAPENPKGKTQGENHSS